MLAGCAPSSPVAPVRGVGPAFDPVAFFSGRTRGEGRLTVAFAGARPVRVESRGTAEADGGVVLDQSVREGDRPVRRRQWRLRPLGAGRWAGTLSDAGGPVTGEVTGHRLHLRFRLKSGLRAEQWLELQAGGRTALNRMVVTKWGVPVARLTETITRE